MQISPEPAKMAGATKSEPHLAGQSGCQPPRNKIVATQQTVTMLEYSAMKKPAKLMLLYSTWKPATSSFSASGRSNGMRLVSAKAAIMKMIKLKICGAGKAKIAQRGKIGRASCRERV